MGKELMKEHKINRVIRNNVMRKICIISFMILLLLSLASCGKPKTALLADEFQSQVKEAGYAVVDISDQYPDDAVEAVLIALNEEDNYQIEFYVVPTESQAITAFDENKDTFESEKGNSSSYSSVSLSNYSKYTLTTNGQYYVISRIGNTFIYVLTTDTNKDAVNNTLKVLGY